MYLGSVSFSSYKRFADSETIEFAPVTVLIGKNSSGKSSVLKLLPMLETSFSGLLKKSVIKFDNDGVVPVSYTHLDVYKRQVYGCQQRLYWHPLLHC